MPAVERPERQPAYLQRGTEPPRPSPNPNLSPSPSACQPTRGGQNSDPGLCGPAGRRAPFRGAENPNHSPLWSSQSSALLWSGEGGGGKGSGLVVRSGWSACSVPSLPCPDFPMGARTMPGGVHSVSRNGQGERPGQGPGEGRECLSLRCPRTFQAGKPRDTSRAPATAHRPHRFRSQYSSVLLLPSSPAQPALTLQRCCDAAFLETE